MIDPNTFHGRLALLKGEDLTIVTPAGAFTGKLVDVTGDYLNFTAQEKIWTGVATPVDMMIPLSAVCGVKRHTVAA